MAQLKMRPQSSRLKIAGLVAAAAATLATTSAQAAVQGKFDDAVADHDGKVTYVEFKASWIGKPARGISPSLSISTSSSSSLGNRNPRRFSPATRRWRPGWAAEESGRDVQSWP